MTDDEHRKAVRTLAEYRETEEAFVTVRSSMVDALLRSKLSESKEREMLYLGVQALDAVRAVMERVIADAQGTQVMDEIAEQFARANKEQQ